MKKLRQFWQKKPYLVILAAIILVSLFFRSYQPIDRFEYAHDGDLYSWIVKDIVVDKHFRLIGQLTTAPGIFIGPFFYYMLIPFFLLFKMDPIGAVIPVTLIGVITTLSYYIVFSKLFGSRVGLIAAFLHAVLLTNVAFDRRIVPSTPTNLWLVWYFYTVLLIARGKLSILPLLGVLAGLIWHIHIALAPVLVAVTAAIVISKKLPSLAQILKTIAAFLLVSIPLIVFELKHSFLQTQSFIANFGRDFGGGTGWEKFMLVLIYVNNNIVRLFLHPQGLPFINYSFFTFGIVLSALFLVKKKLLTIKEVIVFYIWIATIVVYFSLSSTIISEYYFASIEILFITIVSLLFFLLYKSSKWGRLAALALLAIVLTKNLYHFTTTPIYQKGYNERKATAEFISDDSREKGFPCVAVSYITTPGENVGFRHFFWLKRLHVNQPISGSPVYTIVLPPELVEEHPNQKMFGQIKVIPPERIPTKEEIKISCSGQNSNLTDPLFGFTN